LGYRLLNTYKEARSRRKFLTKKVSNKTLISSFQSLTEIQGRWKAAGGTVVPQLSLEESVTGLGGESKEQFLNFIRSMLKWLPEERQQACELLKDPWMGKAMP
jgi:hypothetical protein